MKCTYMKEIQSKIDRLGEGMKKRPASTEDGLDGFHDNPPKRIPAVNTPEGPSSGPSPGTEGIPGTQSNPIDLTRNSNFPTAPKPRNTHKSINSTQLTSPLSNPLPGYLAPAIDSLPFKLPESGRRTLNRSSQLPSAGMRTCSYEPAPGAEAEARDNGAGRTRRLQVPEDANHEWDQPSSMAQPLAHDNSPEHDLVAFLQKVASVRCHVCNSPLRPIDKGEDIVTRTKRGLDGRGALHPFISCPKCKGKPVTSPGCRCDTTQPDSGLPYRVTGENVKLSWCCDHGRLFLIWSICCGTEYKKTERLGQHEATGTESHADIRRKGSKNIQSTSAQSNSSSPSAFMKGVGYGSASWHDDLLGNSTAGVHMLTEFLTRIPSSRRGSGVVRGSKEYCLSLYFQAMTLLLRGDQRKRSSCKVKSAFDVNVPPMLEFIICRSALLPAVAEILRTDEIEHISALEGLYLALLELVEVMGCHPHTSSFIFTDYPVFPVAQQLLQFSLSAVGPVTATSVGDSGLSGAPSPRGRESQLETSASIAQCLSELAVQCQHFNQTASRYLPGFNNLEDWKRKVQVSESIIAAASRVAVDQTGRGIQDKLALQERLATPRNVSLSSTRSTVKLEKLREPRILDLADQVVLSNFYFRNEVEKLVTLAPGRMKAVIGQVSNLRTSLPNEGIWVRYGDSRLDAVKVLIMGPKDTPYHYGLFEFDLFCTAQFPQQPPKMHFRTTGEGRVRFNPNLYENGVVCLSLLGTWGTKGFNKSRGEGWDEKMSTLLQVLLSIQAMIFVDEPYYNEPGHERRLSGAASEDYNSRIRTYTVKHAILHWLNKRLAVLGAGSEQDDPVWGPVIREHFKANGAAIKQTVGKWKNPKNKSANMDACYQEVQGALASHGFTS